MNNRKIEPKIVKRMIAMACEQIAESQKEGWVPLRGWRKGQANYARIAQELSVSDTTVYKHLSKADKSGKLPRTCSRTGCNNRLGSTMRGHINRHVCGLHYVNGDVAPAADPPKAAPPPKESPHHDDCGPACEPEVEAEVEAESASTAIVLRVDTVEGWPLAIVHGEDGAEQARVGHRELAKRLGYAGERGHENLLELARAIWGEKLPVPYREFREGKRGPASREYLLTRHETLKLICRSETAVADKLQDEILAVYEAWLDGGAPPAPAVAPQLDVKLLVEHARMEERIRGAEAVSEERRVRAEELAGILRAQGRPAPAQASRARAETQPKPPASTKPPGAWTAERTSTCPGCGELIRPGDWIWPRRGGGSIHVGCSFSDAGANGAQTKIPGFS